MNIKEAREIYSQGPQYDVGVDAQYYIAKGFIDAHEKAEGLAQALEISRGQWIHSVNKEICLKALDRWRGEGENER